ncbi:N-acetylmuramoyl-L-alanine amidase [Clostridium butyricum]|uniref:N-acetylmuramoyl-L-alanine amidase n=1 Tax=Clostridium butyricum TaxID=1492 RepID=UPI003D0FCD95
MNIKKRFIAILMCLITVILFIQPKKVQAETIKDYNILSDCAVTVKQAKEWAKERNATQTFIDLADLYWKYAEECGGVNPAIAYAQAAKETGYGNFGGVLDESYCNPCGLKIEKGGDDNDPDAHQKFNSWKEGVQAHLDHLALYAGAEGYPKSDTYDPRHFKTIMGRCKTINELGGSGKWAPSATYGEEVNKLYKSLLVFAGIEKEEDVTLKSEVLSINTNVNNSINVTSSIGWKKENNSWSYYKDDNTKVFGWINPDGNWYYLNSDGNMVTGWLKDCDTWYYMNESGTMARGWKLLNNSWYYLQGDGSMVTGLRSIEGKNYYLSENGSMATGWVNINNYRYFFDNDGCMKTGWFSDDNGMSYYYLDKSSGKMIINDTVDGYEIGSDGKRKAVLGSKEDKTYDNNKDDNTKTEGKVIVVDPGHAYGKDEGVKTTIDDINYIETDLNMQVAKKLKVELEKRGFTVILTRTENQKFTDLNDSLSHRVDVANEADAEFFISIHHNAVDGIPEANGIESYYSVAAKDDNYGSGVDVERMAKSKKLAKLINDNIVKKLNAADRGVKSDEQSASGSLFVLRNTNMPAVLVETGFLSNEKEAERCADSNSQQLVAEAIAEVIAENF